MLKGNWRIDGDDEITDTAHADDCRKNLNRNNRRHLCKYYRIMLEEKNNCQCGRRFRIKFMRHDMRTV